MSLPVKHAQTCTGCGRAMRQKARGVLACCQLVERGERGGVAQHDNVGRMLKTTRISTSPTAATSNRMQCHIAISLEPGRDLRHVRSSNRRIGLSTTKDHCQTEMGKDWACAPLLSLTVQTSIIAMRATHMSPSGQASGSLK